MATTSEPRCRDLETQNSVRPSDSGDGLLEVARYLYGAIAAGSILRNPETTTRVPRRALIVAPWYGYGPNQVELTSTTIDAKLVHNMLVRCGYEQQNIRVLCDVGPGFFGLADPTRENILDSLGWLTSGTQPGDHRFFYFSGYGGRVLQEKDKGQVKKARCIRIGDELGGGSRLRVPGHESKTTVDGKVPETTLPYYTESIITRYCELMGDEPQEVCSRVMDDELNQFWSNLPSGSVLTCGNTKMNEGVEFLGVGVPCGGSVDRFGALGVEEEPEFPLTPHDLAESTPWNVLDMMSTQTSLANPPETKMPENMPVQERQAHRIRAKAFIWTGCYERQFRRITGFGVLTYVFAGALGTDVATITPGPITYGDLLRRIRLGNKSGRSR